MKFSTHFSGRIIQITDALSSGDAVSNQVVALDSFFKSQGFASAVYTKWHEDAVAPFRSDLDVLDLRDNDVLIVHFYGYSEYVMPLVRSAYCTKIIVYHNITPHEFFDPSCCLYQFCRQGREQLREYLHDFHFFWGDSQYNLDEMIALGAPPDRCTVIPIIVDLEALEADVALREPGAWLFVGRIAPNKDQAGLIALFASVREKRPDLARRLYLVGGASDDAYSKAVRQLIADLGLEEQVKITGKVSDAERNAYYLRASLYVSISGHEGFGVPLVEAPLFGLPVVALGATAVAETMGATTGLAADARAMFDAILAIAGDGGVWARTLAEQRANARRFSLSAVAGKLFEALRSVLPREGQFKTVSVVICTYNRRLQLQRTLDYLRSQWCPAFEVVVVDGPSDDGSKELLKEYEGRIKVAHNPERNLSKSRNLGIELADGDIVAFIDDDAIPFDDWIEAILREYNTRPLVTAGLGGPIYYAGTFWFQAEDNGINKFADVKVGIESRLIGKDGWCRYNTGTNATFRNDILRSYGFDEQYEYFLDEAELCFRMQQDGHIFGYCDSLFVRHEFAQSHNRKGKHNYNWYSICKNTAYFVAAYSGLRDKELRDLLQQRFQRERIEPLEAARDGGEITPAEFETFAEAVRRGLEQGLEDAAFFPRRRSLAAPPRKFLPYVRDSRPQGEDSCVQPLHVCILSKEFPPFTTVGGIGTLYYHLASELLLMGHHVTVVVPADNAHVFAQGRFRVVFAQKHDLAFGDVPSGTAGNLSWSLSALRALADIQEERPIDVVDSALWDTEALAFALLPAGRRPPVVVRLVTPFRTAMRINQWQTPETEANLFIEAERRLIERADAVVPISECIARTIEQDYGLQRDARWRAIPCGIAYWPFFDVNQEYAEFQELDNIPAQLFDGKRLVVFVGRLERRKGIDLLLRAAQDILAVVPDVHFVIAGRDVEDWTRRVVDLCPQDLRSRMHFLGEVAAPTREKLLARAYCLVFPSRYESFGLVPLEAFVHGVPVVASRSGAIPEVVDEGRAGLLFEAEDAASLAQCVLRLLRDPDLRDRLAQGALQRIRELSSRQSATRTVALYASLLGVGGKPCNRSCGVPNPASGSALAREISHAAGDVKPLGAGLPG